MSPRLAFFSFLTCLTLLMGPSAWSAPPEASDKEHTDRYGDLLPPGAIARMGSVLFYHGTSCTELAFSPDGTILAVSGGGGNAFNFAAPFENYNSIRLLDAATGRQLRQLQGHGGTKSIRFSPDGKRLFSTGFHKHIKIWDVATGKELHSLKGDDLTRDGKTLIVAAPENNTTTIRFTEAATGKQVREITVPRAVWTVVSAPDGKTLAGRADKFIYIWDAATGKKLHQLAGIEKWADNWLAFSPNGEMLAAYFGGAKTVKLWDAATGRELHQWTKFPKFGKVTPAFSPNGKTLAVAGADETIQLWDVKNGKETDRLKVTKASYLGMAFSPDGKGLVWGTRGAVHLWDLAEKRERTPPGRLPEAIEVVAFAPDGKTLLTSGSESEPIRSWEIANGKELRQWKRPYSLRPPVLSPSGKLLAVPAKKLQLFDLTSDREIPLRGKFPRVSSIIAFSPDDRILAASTEEEIWLWDAATGKELRSLGPREGRRFGLAFTQDGKTLLERTVDKEGSYVKMWDVATGKLLGKVGALGIPVFTAISPDGQRGAGVMLQADEGGVGLKDLQILVWDLKTGAMLAQLRADICYVRHLAFSPDSRSLACVYEVGGVIRLWEVTTGQERRRFEGHRQVVTCLAFSADGALLATGSEDHTALVWDVFGRLDKGPVGQSDLSDERLRALWADVAAKDAAVAYRAMCRLLAGRRTVSFLSQQLKPVAALDARQSEQMKRSIADLDHSEFKIREKAAAELEKKGEAAEAALRAALANKPSLEVRRRGESLLEKLNPSRSPQRMQVLRAVEVLEHIATPEAQEVLRVLAGGAPVYRLTREAKASLERLDSRAKRKP